MIKTISILASPVLLFLGIAAVVMLLVIVLLTGSRSPAAAQRDDRPVSGSVGQVTLESTTAGTLVVRWNTPPYRTPTDYRVNFVPGQDPFPSHSSPTGNAIATETSITLEGLQPGAQYRVRVRSRYYAPPYERDPWSGPWSDVAALRVAGNASTPVPTITPAPTATPIPDGLIGNLSLESPESGKIVATWSHPTERPTDYRVSWAKSNEDYLPWDNPAGSAATTNTSYNLTELDPGIIYKVRVRARYRDGDDADSPWSGDWTEGTVTVAGVSGEAPETAGAAAAPSGLKAVVSHNQVVLRWDHPGYPGVTGYRILRGPSSEALVVILQDTGSTDTEYTDTNVTAQTSYQYAVRAVLDNGASQQSGAISASTLAAPATPTSVETTPGDEDQHWMLLFNSITAAREFASADQNHYYYVTLKADQAYVVSLHDIPNPPGVEYQQQSASLSEVRNRGQDATVSFAVSTFDESEAGRYWNGQFLNGQDPPARVTYVFQPAADGQHRLLVAGAPGGVPYGIEVERLPDQSDAASQDHLETLITQLYEVGSTSYAAQVALVHGNIHPGDQDWFAVPLGENTKYDFWIRTDASWTGLPSPEFAEILGPNGVAIGGSASVADSWDYTPLPGEGGLHYFGIASENADGTGLYALEVKARDIPASNGAGPSLRVGGSPYTTLINSETDEDWFTVQLQGSRRYRLQVEGRPGDYANLTYVSHIGVPRVLDSSGTAVTEGYQKEEQVGTLFQAYSSRRVQSALFSPSADGTYNIVVGVAARLSYQTGRYVGAYDITITDIGPQ